MNHYRLISVVAAVVFFFISSAYAAEVPQNESCVVTMVQGTAHVYSKGSLAGRILKKGDMLKKNDVIKLAAKSRLEIRFPDGTIMRLAEKSSVKMNDLFYNNQTKGKKFYVDLSAGKLWATVKKLVTPDSSVAVQTSNAVAGVRGTVYRVNAEEDKSVLVKVYSGTVYVANPPKDDTGTPAVAVSKPTEVPGPREVPPPYHEVSLQEWTIIVKAMQQVSVSADGVASQAQDFDPKAELDDWVLWNLERDKELTL